MPAQPASQKSPSATTSESDRPTQRERLQAENARLRARIARMRAALDGGRSSQTRPGNAERIERVRSMLRDPGSRNP